METETALNGALMRLKLIEDATHGVFEWSLRLRGSKRFEKPAFPLVTERGVVFAAIFDDDDLSSGTYTVTLVQNGIEVLTRINLLTVSPGSEAIEVAYRLSFGCVLNDTALSA